MPGVVHELMLCLNVVEQVLWGVSSKRVLDLCCEHTHTVANVYGNMLGRGSNFLVTLIQALQLASKEGKRLVADLYARHGWDRDLLLSPHVAVCWRNMALALRHRYHMVRVLSYLAYYASM
jgi:hypothetical protein